MSKRFEYDEIIHEIPDNGGAYVIFPWDIREMFGKGRVKVYAEFDGIPYNGIIVNMEVRNLSAPVIKCKKTPRKKCRFVAERRKKR